MNFPSLEANYTLTRQRYVFDCIVPTIIAAVGLVAALVCLVLKLFVLIALLGLVVCAYILFNTFISHSYPEKVEVANDKLTLYSFGQVRTIDLAREERLTLRENPRTKSIYMRLGSANLLSGRYFFHCLDLVDENGDPANDLYDYLLAAEAAICPDSLRVKARNKH